MGHFSDLHASLGEDGLDLRAIADLQVCADCFDDAALQAMVAAAARGATCDFCGSGGADGRPIAADLDDVVGHIAACIAREWTSADGELPWDKETGVHFLAPTVDTDNLLYEIDLELPGDKGRLRQAIVGALPDRTWTTISPLIASPDEAIANSWRAFCHVIKHERRFYFLQHVSPELQTDLEHEEAAYTIPELLDAVAAYAGRAGLYVPVAAGARYIRARERDDAAAAPFGPRRMGPAPLVKATQPNRMSPAGVPMFYGSEKAHTALVEIAKAKGDFAVATFEALRDMVLLDLRRAPDIPSLFDRDRNKDRPFAMFMKEFVDDFQRPVGDAPEVDYVPTQVVTEYFRTVARHDGKPIDGILYESTKALGATAVVLFAVTEDVEDKTADAQDPYVRPRDHWLRMTEYECVLFDPAGG